MSKRILIVEDEKNLARFVSLELQHEGYDVVTADNGREGLEMALEKDFDLILLDLMLPEMDGFEVTRRLQQEKDTYIMMMTARDSIMDIVAGLDRGADDYIVKPFSPGEIIARINAILRRIMPKNDQSEKIFTFDNLEIDLNNFTVKVNDKIISLTKKEIEILWTLATNQNKVFTRENLLDLIWGFDYFGESRTVDTHIKRLRAKLDNYEHKKWNIKTIWGVGYKFDILEK